MNGVTIAELHCRAMEARLRAARLDYKVPGEYPSSASRRYRERMRFEQQAADYEALAAMAAGPGEWLRPLIRSLMAREHVDFDGAAVPEWAQKIITELLPGRPQ